MKRTNLEKSKKNLQTIYNKQNIQKEYYKL